VGNGDEGVGACRGLHVLDKNSLDPVGGVVDHHEEVPAAITRCGEGPNQVHVDVQEPLARHWDGLNGGGWLLGDSGTLAVLTPGERVSVHALPDNTCRQKVMDGTYTWVRQLM
jgi:hypothetical protein